MQMWTKYKQFAVSSVGILFTGFLVTTSVLITWRLYISPNLKRRRYKQNEEFAQYVYEERRKNVGEQEQ